MNHLEEMMECKRIASAAMVAASDRNGLWNVMDSRFTLSGSKPQYAPDRSFDTEHIKIEVALDFGRKSVEGLCTTTLRALRDGVSSMSFDAVHFKVRSVRLNGRKAKFDYDDQKLTVHFGSNVRRGFRAVVAVSYRVVRPKLGMHFIGPDKKYPGKPLQVWTQGEDEYARYWFPCHDAPNDRTTTEVVAKVPRGMTAISNGRLVRKGVSGRNAVFHWKQEIPHATYLVTLAAGKFSEIRDKWRRVPVTYYCPPGAEEDAKRAFGNTPRMMEFFSKKIGVPYAYPKYAQVAAYDFIYGGMENTSATTQTSLTLHDERAHLDFSSDPLVAHELAHQWFGDLLTCKEWSHAWLNESFATYFEALFKEFDKGADEFAYEMNENAHSYFDEDKDHYRRPIVTKVYKQPSDLFDRHLYEKGSVVLHMLRYILGDKDFWKSINTYVRDNRAKVVETVDLMDAVEKATGRGLGQFFDQWVFHAGHPEYKVRYWWNARTREANVRVIQTQNTDGENTLFAMPIVFAFQTARGEKRFTENVEKKSHLFKFKLPSEPTLVLFDPDNAILKKVDFVKPESFWVRQLTDDKHVVGRISAAQALGRIASRQAVRALQSALFKERFWAVQGEIAQALASIRTPEAVDTLLEALDRLDNPKARRMLIAALGEVRDHRVLARLKETGPKEESYFAETQSLKTLGRTGDASLMELFKDALTRESWNDIVRSGALDAITALRTPEAVALLLKHTAWGNAQTTRMAAVRCLTQLGAGRDDVRKTMEALTRDKYLLVQIAAVRALTQIGDERSVPALEKLTKGDWDGRLKRMAEEAVKKLKKGIEDSKES